MTWTRRSDRPTWYVAGLAFECLACGRCCAGPEEGYVWLTDAEVEAIAAFLGLTEKEMRTRYVRRVGRRQSLVERKPTRDCVFLRKHPDGHGTCDIYSVRPTQCRTWPFWATNLADPNCWAEAGDRCPGINRGELIDYEEILRRANATRE